MFLREWLYKRESFWKQMNQQQQHKCFHYVGKVEEQKFGFMRRLAMIHFIDRKWKKD